MKIATSDRLQLWAFIRRGEVCALAVLCDPHAREMVAYMTSTKMDPPASFDRVRRHDLVAALEDDERNGRTGCVACGRPETLRVRAFHDMPKPLAAEMVGVDGKG